MKKSFKKMAILGLAFSVMAQSALAADVIPAESSQAESVRNAVTQYQSQMDTRTTEQRANEDQAILQYQSLMGEIAATPLMSEVTQYPDYYGGAYLNDDGNLVVKVLPTTSLATRAAISSTTNNPDVIFESAEYSLNSLNAVKDLIDNALETKGTAENADYANLLNSITEVILSQKDSTITVRIHEMTQDKVNSFSEHFGEMDFIIFEEGEFPETTATWYPGGSVWHRTNDTFSLGWPADFYSNSGSIETGVVTAGHCVSVGDDVNGLSGSSFTQIGTCIDRIFSGSCDGALIELEPGQSISNQTDYQNATLNRSRITVVLEGSTIYKEGAATIYTTGTILSTNATAVYSDLNTTIRNLIYSTNNCVRGDSGGIVYYKSGSTNYAIGQTSGRENATGYTYTCDLARTQSQLGCSYVPL
nr:hypothetical protein [uncultured Dysosmobacter sp.]